MKCFTFQIHHPILGLYLAPCSADSHALGTLASTLGHLELCDLPDDPNREIEIIIIPAYIVEVSQVSYIESLA